MMATRTETVRTLATKTLDDNGLFRENGGTAMTSKTLRLDRRRAVRGMAAVGAGTLLPAGQATPVAATPAAVELTDEAIMTFVLNLEYLEAEYYLPRTSPGRWPRRSSSLPSARSATSTSGAPACC